ncbi:hypothetical protein B0T21DRAFT_293390 [Apiosordaria backusii]|uniref:Uncharacterized protein n=1 Tax=Apiosordaria backusii TaxID=314023 RepID=A0AA40B2I4_9PEZI|nr:hypothetical protein B0T21DRAFT_293390 [Apiosordaria backusii]
MDDSTSNQIGIANQFDTLSVTMNQGHTNPENSITLPAVTFEYFVKLPSDIQWCIFEELINIEGLRHDPAVHFLAACPRSLPLARILVDAYQQTIGGIRLRRSLLAGIDFLTFDHRQTVGIAIELPPGVSSRYLRLQEIAKTCCVARRVVTGLHANHGSMTSFQLHGDQTILVNTNSDLFWIDILIRCRKPQPWCLLPVRAAQIGRDHLADLLRIPPPMVPGSDLLNGVRRLAVPIFATKSTDLECKEWMSVPTDLKRLEDFSDESVISLWDSLSGDSTGSDALCINCNQRFAAHYNFTWRPPSVVIASAWLPALESVYVIVHDDIPPIGTQDSINPPWRLLPYPNAGDKHPTGEHKHIFLPGSPSYCRRPELRLSEWMQRATIEIFSCAGGPGKLAELVLPYEVFRCLHSATWSTFCGMEGIDWVSSSLIDDDAVEAWRLKAIGLRFNYLRWVPEG